MTDPIVTLDTGRIRGVRDAAVVRYLGVPYAAAPVGERRFLLPQPCPAWDDVRDATRPGASAPQKIKEFPGLDVTPLVGEGWQRGDDYLNVNVWAPAGGGQGLPVMVFIHGGAFVLGGNSAAVQDGSAFARSGVICMSITYRMGVDGFAPIPGVPTNLGLRDQIFALQWVQRNAAAFGGDAANVTVFGESAGAMSIANLVASPLAKGLFRRAIIQSGHGSMVRTPEAGQRLVRKLAQMLRIKPTLDGFRSRGLDETVAVTERISQPNVRVDLRNDEGREPVYGLSKFVPVFRDEVLPQHPLDALKAGEGADVDMLIGTNREEMNLYFVPTGVRPKLSGWLSKLILKKVEPRAVPALKAYGLGQRGQKAGWVFTRCLSDLVFRYPARQFAAAHKGRTHVYELEWRSPQTGGELGACHGIELPFVFNTLASVTGPQGLAGENPPQALADRIHAIWVEYARTGALPWGEYTTADPQVFALEAGKAEREPPMPCAAVLA
ncbi:carboxylesterase/lipase family protein [Brevundimonas lenta]|uniref:Carboxylic ester hydrolase n=1 Tax=Brevundimonas lenta TaxID=424796 RepID=A0A7W6NPS2_9CAUL|nr:carboxylesterase family protein [Brevundimonas lenta]MBB4082457.1 para-nitrobenzyl esterase [Brevundimonas lenta]